MNVTWLRRGRAGGDRKQRGVVEESRGGRAVDHGHILKSKTVLNVVQFDNNSLHLPILDARERRGVGSGARELSVPNTED